MERESLLVAVLVIVSVATLVQALALVGMVVAVRRLEARLSEVQGDLHQRLDRLGQVVDAVGALAESASHELAHVTAEIDQALDRVRNVARFGREVFARPLRPLAALAALWKGLQRGARAYRQLRPGPSVNRRFEEAAVPLLPRREP